ncbi:hypothetical protein Q0M89_14370, partial [Staphylococcus aureus]|nr:hypothetical protein [Staphylococcus aureus]
AACATRCVLVVSLCARWARGHPQPLLLLSRLGGTAGHYESLNLSRRQAIEQKKHLNSSPKSLVLHQGGKRTYPDELTLVSHSGK